MDREKNEYRLQNTESAQSKKTEINAAPFEQAKPPKEQLKYKEKKAYKEISKEAHSKERKFNANAFVRTAVATISALVVVVAVYAPEIIVPDYPIISSVNVNVEPDNFVFVEAYFMEPTQYENLKAVIYNDFEYQEMGSEGGPSEFFGYCQDMLKPETNFTLKIYYGSFVIYEESFRTNPYNQE